MKARPEPQAVKKSPYCCMFRQQTDMSYMSVFPLVEFWSTHSLAYSQKTLNDTDLLDLEGTHNYRWPTEIFGGQIELQGANYDCWWLYINPKKLKWKVGPLRDFWMAKED